MSSSQMFHCDGCHVSSTVNPKKDRWFKGGSNTTHQRKGFAIWEWEWDALGADYCSKQCVLEAQSKFMGLASRST